MKIIIRTCGERTTDKCIQLASKQGQPEIISATPFTESIRQTYKLAMTFDQKWIPVIDADVLLFDNTIQNAIKELESFGIKSDKIFCLDGKTQDKILMKNRRAGIHIYRRDYLEMAFKYIDDKHLKPESNVRRSMTSNEGLITYTSKIIFGKHDYEQYYCDLWRKAVVQTRKLAKSIKNQPGKWKRLGDHDKDYLVIWHAHQYGKKYNGEMLIDKNMDFNAAGWLKKLGIAEKGEF